MRKAILVLSAILLVTTGAFAITARDPIIQARADEISFVRVIASDGSSSIQVRVYGKLLTSIDPVNEVGETMLTSEWSQLPQAWRDALLPVLKGLAKNFNNTFANENTDTL